MSGVAVARVTMVVVVGMPIEMGMTGVAVVLVTVVVRMRMGGHLNYSTRLGEGRAVLSPAYYAV
jgi:hypothetical protein